jgi:hypothetical protein
MDERLRTIRNVAFVLFMATAVASGQFAAEPTVQAFLGCEITDGEGTTQVSGECTNGCGNYYYEVCDPYCEWYAEYTEAAECWVENHMCEEVLDPPPAAVFSCSCLCIYE